MPYLILSDIHGNLEALSAVLDDARGLYDRILCLGDLVGYGADPNAIVEKRIDSTVAPQALFLMNNPFVLTQVKALAQRLLKEAPAADLDRVNGSTNYFTTVRPTNRRFRSA